MRRAISAAVLLLATFLGPTAIGQAQSPFAGRWNLTGIGADADHIYWLEIKDDAGKLSGMFLNRGGSPVPLFVAKVEDGELIFQTGNAARPGPEFRARVKAGGKLTGWGMEDARKVMWEGVHPPVWPPANANGAHTYGSPVVLFDGTSLDAWGVQDPTRPMNWSIVDGSMTNGDHANNLVSKAKFRDFKVHAEYRLVADSNSGIYLRGRYELQVMMDFGKPVESHGHMSIYSWVAPLVNATKPVGEWQEADAIMVGNKVTAVLNGQTVQDNTTIQAITGGALDADETAPGPLMLQGDHSKVWYRKVTVTPITKAGR
jgi:hypothetical protein